MAELLPRRPSQSIDMTAKRISTLWRQDPLSRMTPPLGLILAAPALLIISAVSILPFLYVILLSFYDEAKGLFIGLQNYRQLLASTDFWPSLRLSFVWVAGNLVLQTVVGLLLALLLQRRFFGRDTVRTLLLIPFVVPTAVVALMWQWILNSSFGILNHSLLQLGLLQTPINFLANPSLALPTVIAINSWRWIPFTTLIMFAILQTIPKSHYEAAHVEGAGKWQTFRYITLPYLNRSLALISLLAILLTFNIFDIIWLLTGGGPIGATRTFPVYIYELGFARQNLGGASAASVVLFAILTVFTAAYFWRRDLRGG